MFTPFTSHTTLNRTKGTLRLATPLQLLRTSLLTITQHKRITQQRSLYKKSRSMRYTSNLLRYRAVYHS